MIDAKVTAALYEAQMSQLRVDNDGMYKRVNALEAIVRAVAEMEPLMAVETTNGDSVDCKFCNGWAYERVDVLHEEDCLWTRARKALWLNDRENKT